MSMRYTEANVLLDLDVLKIYVSARKSENSDLMVTALHQVHTLLKSFKVYKPDLRVLYSINTRLIYVATFIKLQRTATGRKPSGTNNAIESARNIQRWLLQTAGPDFPELSQEPTPDDKSQKVCLYMWHYIVNN